MKVHILPLLLFSSNFALAQITVTSATFPVAGDTLKYARALNPNAIHLFTPPGPNQTWDISNIVPSQSSVEVYKPAVTGAHYANFPGADLVTTNPNDSIYFNVTATKFEQLGFVGGIFAFLGNNIIVQYEPPLVERRSPMNIFDLNQQTTNITQTLAKADIPPVLINNIPGINLVDSIRFRRNRQVVEVVDGWGTMTIPGPSAPVIYPVLRQKQTTYTSTVLDVHSFLGWQPFSVPFPEGPIKNLLGIDTTVALHFFSNTVKEIIASATLNSDQNQVTVLRFKNNLPPITPAPEIDGQEIAFSISPNPASDYVAVDLSGMPAGNYRLAVFDLNGTVILQGDCNLPGSEYVRMDIQSLPQGAYIYQVQSTSRRLETARRFLIIK
ncbi:MAG: T9SS type A sorting domain-containing protein [Saprospiraceae bacterium]